jgi:DNA polymerase III epsilon subunit-like protein
VQTVRTEAYDTPPVPDAQLLAQPLASTEFLALDTETNGHARDRCELTEVGAVLVGGGELHERWESLVGVSQPLGRGIQRFTGITQEMVDFAPPPEVALPQLAARLRGRVLVAHNAQFDLRVLRQAFDRAALTWPDPPVICTVALARRFAPLQRRRGLASLADALGIEVAAVHRALPDAETCGRILCALLPRLSAVAGTVEEALALLKPKRAGSRRPAGAKRPRDQRPDLSRLPKDPGVYIFRDADGRPLYVGKSVCLRVRARAHFTTPVAWTGQAEHVDYQPTESELGALLLENRLIKRLMPPGNVKLKKGSDGYVYIRCRLDIPYPILEVASEPAPGNAVCVGPVRGRGGGGRAGRAAQLAVRAAPLRARHAEAAVAVRLRADGPLPVAVPGRPRSQPLPRAPRRGAAAVRVRARRRRRAARPRRRADSRRRRRAGVRARGMAAAATRAAGLARPAARRRAAGGARRRPAVDRAAPQRRRPAPMPSGSWAGASSTGARSRRRRSRRRSSRGPEWRCAARRRRASAGGCRPASSTRPAS